MATPCDVVNQARKALALDGLKSGHDGFAGRADAGVMERDGDELHDRGDVGGRHGGRVTLSNTPAGIIAVAG